MKRTKLIISALLLAGVGAFAQQAEQPAADKPAVEQEKKLVTPSGFLQSLIAELGVDSKKALSFNENQADVLTAISNQRLSVSGVDMDEESMSLVRYQSAYNLSAKVISTMNEIYERLINM